MGERHDPHRSECARCGLVPERKGLLRCRLQLGRLRYHPLAIGVQLHDLGERHDPHWVERAEHTKMPLDYRVLRSWAKRRGHYRCHLLAVSVQLYDLGERHDPSWDCAAPCPEMPIDHRVLRSRRQLLGRQRHHLFVKRDYMDQ